MIWLGSVGAAARAAGLGPVSESVPGEEACAAEEGARWPGGAATAPELGPSSEDKVDVDIGEAEPDKKS